MPSSDPKVYDQQPGEPIVWFHRFQMFLHQGPRRSLLGAYKSDLAQRGTGPNRAKPDSTPPSWRKAAVEWSWIERAEAFDLDRLQTEHASYQELWRARVATVIEEDYQIGTALIAQGRQALEHAPKFFRRSSRLVKGEVKIDPETGEKVRVDREVVYLELNAQAVINLLMIGSRLRRQSTGLGSDKALAAALNQLHNQEPSSEELNASIERDLKALGLWRQPASVPLQEEQKDG